MLLLEKENKQLMRINVHTFVMCTRMYKKACTVDGRESDESKTENNIIHYLSGTDKNEKVKKKKY